MIVVLNFIDLLANILTLAIFARAILSWFPIRTVNPLITILHEITEPILAPLRRVIPMIGFMDISPIVAIVILQLLPSALRSILL